MAWEDVAHDMSMVKTHTVFKLVHFSYKAIMVPMKAKRFNYL